MQRCTDICQLCCGAQCNASCKTHMSTLLTPRTTKRWIDLQGCMALGLKHAAIDWYLAWTSNSKIWLVAARTHAASDVARCTWSYDTDWESPQVHAKHDEECWSWSSECVFGQLTGGLSGRTDWLTNRQIIMNIHQTSNTQYRFGVFFVLILAFVFFLLRKSDTWTI